MGLRERCTGQETAGLTPSPSLSSRPHPNPNPHHPHLTFALTFALSLGLLRWRQVMALIAMEQPLSFEAEHIRAEKLKVLQAVRPLARDNLAVGQYSGTDSKLGYLDDPSLQNKVRPHSPRVTNPHPFTPHTLMLRPLTPSPSQPCPEQDSCTETFAAAVLHVHNPRWDGVPFVLKARPYAPHMHWHVHCACSISVCCTGGQGGGVLRRCTKGVF